MQMYNMSHCQECWSSTPSRDYENIGEPYKALCTVKSSSCPRLHSRNFRSSSAFAARSDCPACLHASSVYNAQFAPEAHFRCCPGIFVPSEGSDVDYRALVPSECHRPGGFYHHVNGYDLVAGVSHGTMPLCTCQHSQNFACPAHTALMAEHGAKFCADNTQPPKYKVISSLKDYADSQVHDCSGSNLMTSFSDFTPIKYAHVKSANSSLVVSTPGKNDKDHDFQLCEQDASLPEDILEWKRKHIEHLQVQQTEASENNITDELKDIKTSSSAAAASVLSTPTMTKTTATTLTPTPTAMRTLTPIPPSCLPQDDDCNQLKCEATAGGDSAGSNNSTESQMLRIEQLEVELHRQQLKVKLYESMLRKHRQDMKAVQLSMQDQKIAYEEQINALQKQLLRFKEQKMNPVTEYINVDTGTVSETLQLLPPTGQNFGAISENSGKVHAETLAPDGVNVALEHRLTRLQQEINREEEALCSLREDLATKNHHLKTLRMTLKEISNCNCELLEKNLELEGMLHRKRNHSSAVRVDAVENRLLKEIDSCVSELNSIAAALVALASGLDPLPAFLLHGCDDGVGQNDITTGNGTDEGMKRRLDRASRLQKQISELRELVMQRILSNHYTR